MEKSCLNCVNCHSWYEPATYWEPGDSGWECKLKLDTVESDDAGLGIPLGQYLAKNCSHYEQKPLEQEPPDNAFTHLIDLKRQESELKDKIKLAQEKAIEVAMEMGKTGQLATIDGAKVTLKLVTVKPNTPMMKAIQEDINDIKAELEEKNAKQIERLQQELLALTTNEDIQELEEELAEEIAKHKGEKKPQIAVTLPKT